MPLHKIEWTRTQCGWALWHITESEEILKGLIREEVCPDEITNPVKRLEWMAGRILLKMLVEEAGLSYQGLLKDEFGKPSLEKHPHPISLSHAYPFVAAQLDKQAVGIDLEQPKDKLLRIAPRVFNPVELKDAGKSVIKNCIYWCAKEALYKIHGIGGISFSKNLVIEPFALLKQGDLKGKISLQENDRLINLAYLVDKDFVLVYTKI